MDFDDYSKISVDAKNVTSLDIEDIDTSSLKEQEKQRYAQDTKYRKHLTQWVMHIVPLWLIGILFITCMCASTVWHLSDIAISALLATTTANILGLAYIVLRGMFPQKQEKSNK